MTGENDLVKKSVTSDPVVLSSTKVIPSNKSDHPGGRLSQGS